MDVAEKTMPIDHLASREVKFRQALIEVYMIASYCSHPAFTHFANDNIKEIIDICTKALKEGE